MADRVVSLPYDVLERQEARCLTKDNPLSFLRIIRSDLEFPDNSDPYAEQVYERAGQNLDQFIKKGILIQEEESSFYLYRLNYLEHQQIGLVTLSSTADYLAGRIKRHELTHPEKTKDRTAHIARLQANTGLVHLLFRSHQAPQIKTLLSRYVEQNSPLNDLTLQDKTRHRIYRLQDLNLAQELTALFSSLFATYIADGHHRAASTVEALQKLSGEIKQQSKKEKQDGKQQDGKQQDRKQQGEKQLEGFFLSVIFPDSEANILPYNRIICNLRNFSAETFLQQLQEIGIGISQRPFSDPQRWEQQKREWREEQAAQQQTEEQFCNLYLEGRWYGLTTPAAWHEKRSLIENLTVTRLQQRVLAPLLGIDNPRDSKHFLFVGGHLGEKGLEELARTRDLPLAFSLPAVESKQLLDIADAGGIMPPKSTWFYPKLRSGFLSYRFRSAT